MGKIYCTECGEELDDSVKFCSSCGASMGSNITKKNNELNDKSIDDVVQGIEAKPLIIGIIIIIVFQVFGLVTINGSGSIFLAIIIASFVAGYLSEASIRLAIIYAILLAFVSTILYFIFPHGFVHMDAIFMLFVFAFFFSFVGNFIKIKLKS